MYRLAAISRMGDFGCNVCSEEYSATLDRRAPRVLSACGHTVCHSCAVAIHRPGALTIFCPFDRIPTSLTDGTVPSLKKNFALLELIDKLNRRRQDDDQTDRFAAERLLGVECDEDATHTAVLFCTVCESNLCERCAEASHSTNVLSRHKRVPLSEKPSPLAHCALHSTYVIEFFCQEPECDAESRLMCLLCRDYGRHKGHQCIFVDKEADEIRKTIEEGISELQRTHSEIQSHINAVEGTVTQLADRSSVGALGAARNDICTHFSKAREKLDREENAALAKLEGYIENRMSELAVHQRRLYSQSNRLAGACSELSKCTRQVDGRLVAAKAEVLTMLDEARANRRVQPPEPSSLLPLIPYHLGKDNRLHVGHFVDARIAVLGLDGAGKTTMLARMTGAEQQAGAHAPTVGFNMDTVHHRNFRLNMIDVGGGERLRSCWRHYFAHNQAVMFVLDGSNAERFPEAITELLNIARQIEGVPLLLVVNRRRGDESNSASIAGDRDRDATATLDRMIASLSCQSPTPVVVHHVDAATGAGLRELLDDLTARIESC